MRPHVGRNRKEAGDGRVHILWYVCTREVSVISGGAMWKSMYGGAKSGPVSIRVNGASWDPCTYARGFLRQDSNGVPEGVVVTHAGLGD